MKVQRSVALKYTLGILSLCLYSLGALLGLVLMSVASWQYSGYADNPEFYRSVYSPDIQVILLLFLTSGLLLMLLCLGGILFCTLFLLVKNCRGSGWVLGLLGTGLVLALTLETIAVTVQWEHWNVQFKVLPGILENGSIRATFSSDDWFGRQLAWFQDTFECCGYNDGADYTNGPGAMFAVAEAINRSATLVPDLGTWRPRSCCDDFTVRHYECTEMIASYNGRGRPGGEGCGGLWVQYLSGIQWALVGLAISAGLYQGVLLQIPLWLLLLQLVYAPKKEGLLDEEEE